MKFSATITLQYDTDFSPFSARDAIAGLDWAAKSGLDGVELCISHYNGLDLGYIQALLESRGLGCSTISTGQARGREGLALTGVSSELCKTAQQRLRQHIDAASRLQSKVTIGLLRGGDHAESVLVQQKQLREAMLPIVEYAEKKEVMLCIEAINRYETTLLNSAWQTMGFIQNELGAPRCVGMLWDLFHANIEEADWRHSIAVMGKRLQHLHLADSNRAFPGYGHIDLASILRYVKDTGYQEYCSFECLNQPSCQAVRKETGPWVQAMRRL